MIDALGKSVGDVIAVLVALWFIFADAFADMPAKPFLDTVAIFVIGLSLWRIWKRVRARG